MTRRQGQGGASGRPSKPTSPSKAPRPPRPGARQNPHRQERGVERRRQVLEATLRLLSREGPRAVTHRAVAAEAGTTLRATTYYFASREALFTEALEHYAQTALGRFAGIQEAFEPSGGDSLSSDSQQPALLEAAVTMLADVVLSDLTDDRAGLVAEYELVLEIGRKPRLAGCYARWQDALLSLVASFARRLGSRDPDLHARIVLASLRGLEIEALACPETRPERDDLQGVFRTLLLGLLAGAERGTGAATPPEQGSGRANCR